MTGTEVIFVTLHLLHIFVWCGWM